MQPVDAPGSRGRDDYARGVPPPPVSVEPGCVLWQLADPERELDRVRLWSDFDLGDTSFTWSDGGWRLRRQRDALPPVARLEYLFEVTRDGDTNSTLDPDNPLRVGGAYGDHSVLALDYRPPAWLDVEPVDGQREELTVAGLPIGDLHAQVWSPAGTEPGDELPLLLSHDGPEMDSLGELTRFVGAMIALRQAQGTGGLPPMRVGLLAPGARNERYAANPAYAEALCDHLVPALRTLAPGRTRPVLIGQSLGALAALHAEWTHPGTFGGLLLQSGSFFTRELDEHESGFSRWAPVTEFVAEVHRARRAPSSLPVGICFGTAEENAANNQLLAKSLTDLGLPVAVGEVRDGHTFTCWRDLLDPHLVDLLHSAL